MKKLFLDTSIISAYFDHRKTMRQRVTQKWFQSDATNYDLFVSDLVVEEIQSTSDQGLRKEMLSFVRERNIRIVLETEEIRRLASLYRKIVLRGELNDTILIATATWYRFDALVSWNFRHIVNLKTMNAIHRINQENNYGILEIVTLQQLEGNTYESL